MADVVVGVVVGRQVWWWRTGVVVGKCGASIIYQGFIYSKYSECVENDLKYNIVVYTVYDL